MSTPDAITTKRLLMVTPKLAQVTIAVINASSYGVRVTNGIRTQAEQRALVAMGKSRTMNSLHLPQGDGKAHANDVVAMIGEEPDWDDDRFFEIANLYQIASKELSIPVVWGGIWSHTLAELPFGGLKKARESYVEQFRAKHGRRPFKDLPHFQLGHANPI